MGEVLTVYLIITLVSSIVYGIIFGKATNAVIANKGYDEDWFWWGFFFGIIAFIVALTKPQNPYQEEKTSAWTAERAEEEKLRQGGWKCKCGRVNSAQTGTCACGERKGATFVSAQRKVEEEMILKNGGWRCKRCGTLNKEFIGFCPCGMTRGENKKIEEKLKAQALEAEKEKIEEKQEEVQEKAKPQEVYDDKFQEVKRYKELLDSGIITEEEFNKKKAELLGL